MLGTFSLSAGYQDAYYKKALGLRGSLHNRFQEVFQTVDAIILPTSPSFPYYLGRYRENSVESYQDDVFTVPASLGGYPALSVPVGVGSNGLPIGAQIIGNRYEEELILKIGKSLEDLIPPLTYPSFPSS